MPAGHVIRCARRPSRVLARLRVCARARSAMPVFFCIQSVSAVLGWGEGAHTSRSECDDIVM